MRESIRIAQRDAIPRVESEKMIDFGFAVLFYFRGSDDEIHHSEILGCNAPRSCLLDGLKFLFSMSQEEANEIVTRYKESGNLNVVSVNREEDRRFGFMEYVLGDPRNALTMPLRQEMETANWSLTRIKKLFGILLVDSVVAGLQDRYAAVVKSFLALKGCSASAEIGN